MSDSLNATVSRREDISDGLFVLHLHPDFDMPEFKAGQYGTIGLPGTAPRLPDTPEAPLKKPEKLIRRAYSIASGSIDRESVEFYIALVDNGALTPRLNVLKEGDRVHLGERVVGNFTLDVVPPENDVIFLATGTGLAPYLSMLRSNYDFSSRSRTLLLQGARQSWDLGYRDELNALAEQHESFTYVPMISRPANEKEAWEGALGRITSPFSDGSIETFLDRSLTPHKLSVFLCGNPDMIVELVESLSTKGFSEHSKKSPGNLIVEKYW
jgi:ferredoxin--NADP+ reductase